MSAQSSRTAAPCARPIIVTRSLAATRSCCRPSWISSARWLRSRCSASVSSDVRRLSWPDCRESVARALSALPVDYRMAITLVDIQEMSLEEAAKVLGITVGALKSRLLRGRLRLREEFNKK